MVSPAPSLRRWRWRWAALAAVALLAAVWFGLGSIVRGRIDDNPAFAPAAFTPNASAAVDTVAALVLREVDVHGWQPNDPWFYPTAFTDNAAHFQSGVIWALSRFTSEFTDRVGRLGTAARLDPDLQRASGMLQYPGDVWVLDLRSVLPAPSEVQYRSAADALLAYNKRLSAGDAVFDTRADNLAALLSRLARDLGAEAESIDDHVAKPSPVVFSRSADDLFYQVKGAIYAHALLLRALRTDFQAVIADRHLGQLWDAAQQAIQEAAALYPTIVLDASPSSMFASHLASQGFYVLRAQTRIADLARALEK